MPSGGQDSQNEASNLPRVRRQQNALFAWGHLITFGQQNLRNLTLKLTRLSGILRL